MSYAVPQAQTRRLLKEAGNRKKVVNNVSEGTANDAGVLQEKPAQDTPYRQLSLMNENGWRVRLVGGTRWGRGHAEELEVVFVQSFAEGKVLYDEKFRELESDGWRSYSPYEIW